MAEARYYGETLPFGNETFEPANLQWLTTELILADYALLLKTLKATVLKDHADCPVLAFGGSYGGTLTTLFRLSYPDVVVGALAASAPIGYYDPEHWTAHGVDAYFRRADLPLMNRGDAAAATWIFCGDTSHARGYSVETRRTPQVHLDKRRQARVWRRGAGLPRRHQRDAGRVTSRARRDRRRRVWPLRRDGAAADAGGALRARPAGA